MTIDTVNNNHIIATEGKEFVRISDNFNFGSELYLGYTYYLNGVALSEPVLEKIEDFMEIDKVIPEEIIP